MQSANPPTPAEPIVTITGEGRLFGGAPIPNAYFGLCVQPDNAGVPGLTLHLRVGPATARLCNPAFKLRLETHDGQPTAVYRLGVTLPPLALRALRATAIMLGT